ncbi:unnamed protein product, partial [Meganyctiphanes norvegica]
MVHKYKKNVKDEIEVYEEPVLSKDVEVAVKEEWESNLDNKTLPRNSHSISHQRTNIGGKPYQLYQCVKPISQKVNLSGQQKTHTCEKIYLCNQCGKEFSQKRYLKSHQGTHIVEKPYQCNQCDKAFSRNIYLIKHQRIHTEEKPYQCKQCNK